MQLKALSDLIVFDEFPFLYNRHQTIVLTHLLHLEKQLMPERLCRIITSKYLANMFREHCRERGVNCYKTLDITEVDTDNKFTEIKLPDLKGVEILLCESKELTRNLMAFIQVAGKLSHIYAGNFLDLRTALLNETCNTLIGNEVPHLYLNLKRCQENPEKQDVDQMFKALEFVELVLECHSSQTVHMHLPQFGYDNFIYNLARKFPKRISVVPDYKSSLNPLIENEMLSFSIEHLAKAKIILLSGEPPKGSGPRCPYTNREKIVLHIQENSKALEDEDVNPEANFYSIYYTPEPSPFHLQLMCLVLNPQRISGIIDGFNIISKVPFYLMDLRGNRTASVGKKEQSRFSDTLHAATLINKTNRALSYGPKLANQDPDVPQRQMYLDDSSSD